MQTTKRLQQEKKEIEENKTRVYLLHLQELSYHRVQLCDALFVTGGDGVTHSHSAQHLRMIRVIRVVRVIRVSRVGP